MKRHPRSRTAVSLSSVSALAVLAGTPAALGQNYLLLVADTATATTPLRDSLIAAGLTNVDVYTHSTTLPTPTLAELMNYSAVLTYTNQSYADGAAMGNVLADYVDAGGGVVCAVFCVSTITANRSLTGRWQTGGYDIIPQRSGNLSTATSFGAAQLAGHPLWTGMTGFSGYTGANAFARQTTTTLSGHGYPVAQWATDQALVAASGQHLKRVDVGFYPTVWHPIPDGVRLLANALQYAATGGSASATGACCLLDGTCSGPVTFASCQTQSGMWRGPDSACASANCPQPGACCAADGTCSFVLQSACDTAGGTWTSGATCASVSCVGACCVGVGTCSLLSPNDCTAQAGFYWGNETTCAAVSCTFFPEVEPNTNKAEATPLTLAHNEGLRGTCTGTVVTVLSTLPTSVDYFRLKTAAAPPGVYQHRLTLQSATPGHSAWVRGLTQSAAAAGPWPGPIGTATATESAAQAHLVSGTDRVNAWYGFGRQEEVYYRVAGTTSTTADYIATLQTTPITPTSLGAFNAGGITLDTSGQGHTNDTSVRIYDSNLDPIPGSANDDASINGGAPANSTTTSFLRREYPAGTYYLAVSSSVLATNQGAPCDDNGRTGAMMDFPNVAVDTGTGTFTDLSFAITDSAGTQAIPAGRAGRGEIAWFTFTVTGTIGTGGCCFADGSCSVVSAFTCAGQGGAYRGDNTSCTPICPQPPTGACCLPGGTCTIVWLGGCTAQGGIYSGDNTTCANPNCISVVVPNANETIEGATSNAFPFTSTAAFFRYQQVYAASDFAGLSGPHEIRALHFRPNATSSAPVWSNSFDLDLRLSTTTAGPDSLVATFAANVGPDEAVVYSGPVTISTSQVTPVTGPALFDVAINFQTPFVYDPAGGNLLVHLVINGSTIGTTRQLDAVSVVGDPVGRVTTSTVGATTGTVSSIGLVTRFVVEPAGVACYANCDESTQAPVLNVADFGCFLTRYAAGEAYANCDDSTQSPVLNVADFGCFLTKYAAGCP